MAESVRSARHFLADWLAPSAISADISAGLLLVVSEAASNAIVHGSPGGHADRFLVQLSYVEHRISVRVRDFGPGFDYTGIRLPSFLEEHGRGLFLMAAHSHAFEVLTSPHGTEVCCHVFDNLRLMPGTSPVSSAEEPSRVAA